MNLRKIILGILALGTLSTAVQASPVRKKFIAHGWDTLWAQPQELVQCLDQLLSSNLDGISMALQFREPGKAPYGGWQICNDQPYERLYLEHSIACGRKLSAKLKHNFMITMFAPATRLRWDDDRSWARVAHNFGVVAWAAKQSGFKGVIWDPEDYGGSCQFGTASDEDYEIVSKLARKRGAQFMSSALREFPDITVLGLYLLAYDPEMWNNHRDAGEQGRINGNLRSHFINGMLDVMTPEAKLVEGCEFGYVLEFDANEYYRMRYGLKQRASELIAPENLNKFHRQYQVGFGLYLDPYVKTKYPHKTAFNGSVYKRLVGNLCQAVEVADEYCWLYGEQQRWFYTSEGEKNNTWPVWIEDVAEVISFAKDPVAYTRKWLKQSEKAGKLPQNLACNPECIPTKWDRKLKQEGKTARAVPVGWGFWQSKEGKDRPGYHALDMTTGHGDSTSLMARGTGNCSFFTSVKVMPGEWYVAEAYCKGGNYPNLRMRWQSEEGWHTTNNDVNVSFCEAKEDVNGWRRAVGLARAPLKATRMVITLGDFLLENSDATVRFDSLRIYSHPMNQPKPIRTRE